MSRCAASQQLGQETREHSGAPMEAGGRDCDGREQSLSWSSCKASVSQASNPWQGLLINDCAGEGKCHNTKRICAVHGAAASLNQLGVGRLLSAYRLNSWHEGLRPKGVESPGVAAGDRRRRIHQLHFSRSALQTFFFRLYRLTWPTRPLLTRLEPLAPVAAVTPQLLTTGRVISPGSMASSPASDKQRSWKRRRRRTGMLALPHEILDHHGIRARPLLQRASPSGPSVQA